MSRVYFTSPSGDVTLTGAERHHLSHVTSLSAIGASRAGTEERWRALAPSLPREGWRQALELALRVTFDDTPFITWAGTRVDLFSLVLNTAIAQSHDDPLTLAARIHGQCEIHCWCDGPDRAWLAEIIDRGLSSGVFRTHVRDHATGWDAVTRFLRSRSDEPVVLWYSVCESFPDPCVIGWQDDSSREFPDGADITHEKWNKLSTAEQWEHGMRWLTATRSSARLQLTPDDWDEYRFGHGLTIADLLADNYTERLEKAFPPRGGQSDVL